MLRVLRAAILMSVGAGIVPAIAQNTAQPTTQAPLTPPRALRPTPPTRDPHTPGYVAATELPDGAIPPANADGNFIIGPTHDPAPEMTVHEGVPQGTVYEFTMSSADSKIYPGIARDPGTFGTPDPADPAKLVVTTSHPAPYTRRVAVYVPQAIRPGHGRALHRRRGRSRPCAVYRTGQSDRRAPGAGDDRHLHRQWRRRRAGQRARPGIRHHVRPLCGVRRDRSAAARRSEISCEADQGSRRHARRWAAVPAARAP